MKRILLIAGVALAVQRVLAADPVPAARAAPTAASTPANNNAPNAVDTEQARKQLGELRTQMQELSRKMAALSSELGEGGPRSYALRYLGTPDRAMVGVVLAGDDKGVRLSAVTPDGPAARAGLRDGDVITSIDHQEVGEKTREESIEKARGLLANLKDGQNITIDYARGAQKGVVVFAAERREAWNWPLLMSEDPDHPFLPKDFNERLNRDLERSQHEAERVAEGDLKQAEKNAERAEREAQQTMQRDQKRMHDDVERATRDAVKQAGGAHGMVRLGMPWWGLNLAPLNADLGRYFGTDKGVLVIAADDESLPGIRAGDVITSVAGEPVSRPEDALRALRDQQSGKDVPIKLMRERKTLALNMKAPAFKSIFDMRGAPPTPPVAPVAPGAPAPPVAATLRTPPAPPVPATIPIPRAPAVPASMPTPPAPPAPPSSPDDDAH